MPAPKNPNRKLHQRRPSPAPAYHVPATPADAPALQCDPRSPNVPGTPPRFGEGKASLGEPGEGPASPPSPKGGPRTPQGRAVSARNATTHGLFCRQTVLPHLGEDPQAYKTLLDTLHQQFDPRTVVERQYLELWADASWKLRRLSRLEAQIWENDQLDEDARLLKLERVLRLQAGVRRQLDKALMMLGKLVPDTQERYARRAALAGRHVTESDCRLDPRLAAHVESDVQADILCGASVAHLDQSSLDTARPADTKNRQNEPLRQPAPLTPPELGAGGPLLDGGLPADRGPSDAQNAQNEPGLGILLASSLGRPRHIS